MYILAYKDGHDPAACILRDGKIIAAAEEERFNRIKHAPSIFPQQSIAHCLRAAGISPSQVDAVVYARLKALPSMLRVIFYYITRPPRTRLEVRYALSHIKIQLQGVFQALTGRAGYRRVHTLFPGLPKKIYQFDHHLCHAASAYLLSGFDDALIITLDGKGEATSVAAWQGRGTLISNLEKRGIFESLGLLYSAATRYLGFTPNDGEYKVMGLAPYGTPSINFDDVLRADADRGYVVNSDFVLYPLSVKNFEKRFGQMRRPEDEMTDYWKNFAASLQLALESSALSYIKYLLKSYPAKNLCLAGGVALNVKMNRAIWESELFENMFVQPAAGDNGLVFGAAALMYVKKTGKRPEKMQHLYLGPAFTEDEITQAFESAGVQARSVENIAERAADLIAEGKVIGWFQSHMEFGPRALGARSVLAHPGLDHMKDLVNSKIKFRESFRPFCPSVLASESPKLFKSYLEAPFMVMSFAVSDERVARLMPAVVHVDGTVRPQAVSTEYHPLYAALLEAFHKKTGIPAVLNTSMNIRGEPIVCTPQDCINFFVKTHVDAIIMGNQLAIRSEQGDSVLKPMELGDVKTQY